jgi:hypothetical protein
MPENKAAEGGSTALLKVTTALMTLPPLLGRLYLADQRPSEGMDPVEQALVRPPGLACSALASAPLDRSRRTKCGDREIGPVATTAAARPAPTLQRLVHRLPDFWGTNFVTTELVGVTPSPTLVETSIDRREQTEG